MDMYTNYDIDFPLAIQSNSKAYENNTHIQTASQSGLLSWLLIRFAFWAGKCKVTKCKQYGGGL